MTGIKIVCVIATSSFAFVRSEDGGGKPKSVGIQAFDLSDIHV